jgi:DNA-binding NtrC family response regulator
MAEHALIIDDEITKDEPLGKKISKVLKKLDYEAIFAQTWGDDNSGEKAKEIIDQEKNIEFILLDLIFKGQRINGYAIIDKLQEMGKDIPVFIFTVKNDIESVMKAFSLKAQDYIVKSNEIEAELYYKLSLFKNNSQNLKEIMGGISRSSKEIFQKIEKLSNNTIPLLIYGETGTGKEVVARSIHNFSKGKQKDFIALNCACFPGELFESELFGHKKGAFTGALEDKPGLVETKNGGTLFLDEINSIPLPQQAKLLRFLHDKTFRRLGETKVRTADVRIMSATNKNLIELIKKGEFREDLYYRLNVFPINLPPLRERKDDIPILVGYLLKEINDSRKGKEISINKKAVSMFLSYSWPGNIRELKNVLETAGVEDSRTGIIKASTIEMILKNRADIIETECNISLNSVINKLSSDAKATLYSHIISNQDNDNVKNLIKEINEKRHFNYQMINREKLYQIYTLLKNEGYHDKEISFILGISYGSLRTKKSRGFLEDEN